MMSDSNVKDKQILIKYCKIMISKLNNIEDEIRMTEWLDAATDSKCGEEVSCMYLELILWALHTDRIDVFPFKYAPPVDHGDITDVYKFAQEIVQFEPDDDVRACCGQVETVVSDDLKEYLAVQSVGDLGTQCFYAFSDRETLPTWNMPSDVSASLQNNLKNESQYWSKIFSRPKNKKIEITPEVEVCNEDNTNEEVDESIDEEAAGQKSENDSTCPDLCKVEQILENLSFGAADFNRTKSDETSCPSLSGNAPENRKSITGFLKVSSEGCCDREQYCDNGSSQKQDGIKGPDLYCVQNLTVVKPFFNNFTSTGYKKINKKLGTSKANNYNIDKYNDKCNRYKKQMEKIDVQRHKGNLGQIINNDYAVSSCNLIEKGRDHFQTEERVISISDNGETLTDTCSESTVRLFHFEKKERKLSEDSCVFEKRLSNTEGRSEPVTVIGNKVPSKESKSNVLLENKKSLYSNESSESREFKTGRRRLKYKNRFLRSNNLVEENKKIDSFSRRNDPASRRNTNISRLLNPPEKDNSEKLYRGNFSRNSSSETNREKLSVESLLFKKFQHRFPRAYMFKPSSVEPSKSKFNAISKRSGNNSKKDSNHIDF